MKKIFRKAMTIAGSAALIGMTVGVAAAAAYPDPFTSNTAVVYGANAAPSDSIAAGKIVSNLNANAAGTSVTTLSGAEGVTENEVVIGGALNTSTGSKIVTSLTDSKIGSLLDTKINWDDGGASGADDYNVHEEIRVGSMSILTTLTDNDFEELLALSNDKQLEYRYVFDDGLNVTGVGATSADDFYLTILGKSYEISGMTTTTLSVTTSEEVSVGMQESVTVEGETFTLDDLSTTSARVNGEVLTIDGSSKKINGLQVEASNVFYNDNFPETASVTLKIGSDITKTYSSGEEYIGEDEDDPTWVWSFSSDLSADAAYIGVKYNQGTNEYDDDGIVYEGGSYLLPEDFGAVTFDGTTDVAYEDFEIYFDDSEDLWNSTDLTSTEQTSNAPVLIIEASNGAKDAITTAAGQETNKIYLRWAPEGAAGTGPTQVTKTDGSLEVFYSNVNGDVGDVVKPRFSANYTASDDDAASDVASAQIAEIIVGDTIVNVNISVAAGDLTVSLTDEGAGQAIYLDVDGANALGNTTGSLEWFGATSTSATSKEIAETTDLIVTATSIGKFDNDVITTNGLIIASPEANLDNDKVVISVPNDRVYAEVSVVAGGEATTTGDAGVMIVKDDAVSTVAGKNLVVVGGSAINSVAAELLEGAHSEGAFTTATGVGAGEFLIQSFDRAGKTALLVAGYNAADTEKAVDYLLNYNVDTTAGTKLIGTSAISATVVTTA